MYKKLILAVTLLLAPLTCFSQNKVVVVPLGGVDGPFAEMYWVTVSSIGQILAMTPGVESATRASTGNFRVRFDVADVSDCFVNANIANTNQINSLEGSIGATRSSLNDSEIFLRVVDLDGVNADLPFTVQLACPPEILRPIVTKEAAPAGNQQGSEVNE